MSARLVPDGSQPGSIGSGRRAIRFLLGEYVHAAVGRGLRARGIDAITVAELGLEGADDEEVLNSANAEGRVVVTHDADYVRGVSHAGICYSHQRKHAAGRLLTVLVLVHECLSEEEMAGHLENL